MQLQLPSGKALFDFIMRRGAPVQIIEPRKIFEADNEIGVSAADFAAAYSIFNPLGLWRLELETGLVFWSKATFELHEMSHTTGPVNFQQAVQRYHEDDQDLLLRCVEEASAQKTGFQYTLRLDLPKAGVIFVNATALFREKPNTGAEFYGSFNLVATPAVSAEVLAENPACNAVKLG